MKNKEKFQDQLIEAFSNGRYCEFKYNYIFKKGNCTGHSCQECSSIVRAWFEEENKEPIKLSDVEKVILENIKRYEWIARDLIDNNLYLYKCKPYKSNNEWSSPVKVCEFDQFNHLFQFVKWEDDEPYNIKELLRI